MKFKKKNKKKKTIAMEQCNDNLSPSMGISDESEGATITAEKWRSQD